MTPVIHPDSQRLLETALSSGAHALLLSGKHGVGLGAIARHYTNLSHKTVLTVLPQKDEKVDLEKGVITVEQIRTLYDTVRTKMPEGRIIVIDYAERMGAPAQNAFLKLLEEPNETTSFMLLSHTPDALLPTVRSRVQEVMIRPITRQQSEEVLTGLKINDTMKRTQLLFIAEGLPAELTRLAADDAAFTKRVAVVKDARTFVAGTPYDRLRIAKNYKDNRPQALLLLEDAMKQLAQTLAKGQQEGAIVPLEKLERLHKRIVEQGNIRLQLSSVVLLS